jgi:hypothetical protein
MRLDWGDVRARAAKFSEDWKFATRESADKHSFWNAFFDCFGIDRRQVATYERRVENLPRDKQGFIDLLMPGKLIVEHKSAGLDLRRGETQAFDYNDALPLGEKARYVLTCDFQNWNLLDLEENRRLRFKLPELKKHITAFAFIPGVEVRRFKNQKPANPKATELLTAIHRQLEEDGYSGHELQLLLVRLLFCLFADDTGIWEKDILFTDLQEQTKPDGCDLGAFLTQLFETLNTHKDRRQANLPDYLKRYEYINGKLFEEPIRTAAFNNALRSLLIDASAFDWGTVSPAIFGALFEGVIDKVTQRQQGAHYTPEEAIFRLIGPLFLEELHDEFDRLKSRSDSGRASALRTFQDKLASLTFFDPACGAGNFLVVTYREIRELERCVIEELYPPQSGARQGVLDVKLLTKVNVDQFYGIEIDEFPSQIAQVALWMTDHIANVNLGEMFGRVFPDMPIVAAPHIRHADALDIDWNQVLPADDCDYVFGNPPFVGAKKQTDGQRKQVRTIAKLGGSGGTLDYVAAWFLKAGDYIRDFKGRIAFVATNSITQGEQVGQLWPKLFNERKLEIAFGHRTFVWPGKAAVHCVIIGLAQRGDEPTEKRLFSYPELRGKPVETRHAWLTAYLFDAEKERAHGVVNKARNPISAERPLVIGSKPVDGGYLIFEPGEHAKAIKDEPALAKWLRPYVGAEEYLNGGKRWIAALQDCAPQVARNSPTLRARLRDVKAFRLGQLRAKRQEEDAEVKPRGATALALAETPSEFHITQIPKSSFLLLPRVTSERREWAAIGWVDPPTIPSDSTTVLLDATRLDFAILSSAMHMAWLRYIGGRLESRYRYSIGLVYNTFPWPEISAHQRTILEALGQAILDARELPKNATSTLADLYDPDFMPTELRKAHRELDAAVDKLYSPKGFADERGRVEYLFRLYERHVMPTTGAAAANRRTARRITKQRNPKG